MIPAHKRFEARELVRRKPGDGLIEDGNLLTLKRHAQLALEWQAILLLRTHGRIEDLDTVGALTLRAKHRDLAIVHHFLRRGLRSVVNDNADGRGEDDLLGADLHWRAQRAPHPLGQSRDMMRVAVGNQ